LLYGTVWSVFTVVSVYTVMAHASRRHELMLAAFVAGFLLLAALSRAVLGPHAARAAAFAFAPMVVIAFGSSRTAQNTIVFGFGDWCGTGRLNDAIVSASMALPMGLCSMGLWYFLRMPSRQRRSTGLTARPYILMLVAAALGLGAVLAAVRAGTRASVQELRADSTQLELIPIEELRSRVIESNSGFALELSCTNGRWMDPQLAVPVNRLGCVVSLPQPMAVGKRSAFNGPPAPSAPPSTPVQVGDEIAIERGLDGRVWRIDVLRAGAQNRGETAPLAVLLDGARVPYVRAGQLAPALGPRPPIAMLGALACLPLLALIGWVVRSRRRIATVMGGREGELDAEGRVRLGSDYLPLAAGLRGMEPGPVVVLRCVESEHYRATQSVSELLPGTQDELVQHEVEVRKEWTTVVVVAAAVLAAPLVAAATLGLL
jgi:hypothetical protein